MADLSLHDVVDLPGFDANPYAYFKYAALFVLSSNWEGLPGVLIQALASKVKVVSTDCPSGPMEILDHAKFGLLVPCNDQPALSSSYAASDLCRLCSHILQKLTLKRIVNSSIKQRYCNAVLKMMESAV